MSALPSHGGAFIVKLIVMSPESPDLAPLRPAAVVDAEIRALLVETGGWLWGPTRERYERLRDEWVAAVREDITTAA